MVSLAVLLLTASPADYPTVCTVTMPDGSRGTGCCVYSQSEPPASWVLTAAHVVGGSRRASCRWPDGDRQTGQVTFANYPQDVAVIVTGGSRASYTPISREHPSRGDAVTFVGYAGEYGFRSYAGRVLGVSRAISDGRAVILTRIAGYPRPGPWPGDSGGPVLFRGRVVATITGYDDWGQAVTPTVQYGRRR